MQLMHTYRVRLHPQQQEISIELTVSFEEGAPPGAAESGLLLEVPSWVPGAYAFMRYARDLFDIVAADARGNALPVVRETWNGFRVAPFTGTPLTVRYRAAAADGALWAELAGVVRHDQAVLLGTRYLRVAGYEGPCKVIYDLPEEWPVHHPSGARYEGDRAWTYPSFGVLLDTPVVCGAFERRTREVQGTPFHMVFLDRCIGFDDEIERFSGELADIAAQGYALFGSFPFTDYTFVISFDPRAHWGLEHANATMLGLGDVALIDAEARLAAHRVAAHELVHAWNVCRLKPAALVAPDRARGAYPDGLWLSEGVTRYYEFLFCTRARLMSGARFVSNVARYYQHLTALPAYARTSSVDSSLGTFTNHNRFPGSVNCTIDYYDKGMLVAFDMDAELRARGAVGTTLDTVFRAFYTQFAETGFTNEAARAFFTEAGLGPLYAREVDGLGGLTVPEKLASLGLEPVFHPILKLGIILREARGPMILNATDDGPAAEKGVAAEDEILEVDGYPFHVRALLYSIAKGREIELAVRRGHRRVTFKVTPRPHHVLTSLVWRGTDAQLDALRAWTGDPTLTFLPGQILPLEHYDNFHGTETVI